MANDNDKASEERIRALADALRAVTHSGMAGNLHQNVSTANTLWKWAAGATVGIILGALTFADYRANVRANTNFIKEWGPRVKVMWWMKESGLTNKDVEPIGTTKVPKFEP